MIRQTRLRDAATMLLVAATVAAVCPPEAVGQTDRVAGYQPRTYAVVNARLVVRPGVAIERGSLVIRDGLIVAAGRQQDIDVPADAEVVDAAGLVVYAGFIDAATSDLLDSKVQPPPAGRTVDFTRYALAATRPDNRRGLTPGRLAPESLKLDGKTLDELRKAGFTDAHVLPSGRIASGQGALVSTSGSPPRESVLIESTFAEFQLLALGGKSYPATLMGATAHLRQALLDARHHARHWELYRNRVDGVSRPSLDPALDALNEVLAGTRRAVFLAEGRDDIHRALDFGSEHELQVALWGAREAHRCIERLKAAKADLVVQIDFGGEPKVTPNTPADELTADVKSPVRHQQWQRDEWRRRVGGLADLHRAGVRFAVTSRGLKSRAEVRANLRRAIEAGLPPSAALAALTTSAAEILGIEDRLGTLEPGKLGHVVIMSGPFDHEKAKVRYVLIDGQKFEYNDDAKSIVVAEKPVIAPRPDAVGQASSLARTSGDAGSRKGTSGDACPTGTETNPVRLGLPEPVERELPVVAKKPHDDAGVFSRNPDALPTELETDRTEHRPLQTGGNVFIQNATVLTGTGRTLPGTSILVEDGKIAAIGTDLVAPSGTAVVDATGHFVMPGVIDTHSHIMITSGVNEATQSIVPEVRIKDVVNSGDVSEYRALAGGTTTARLLHGSANVIGGQDAVVKLKYGKTASEHILHDAPQGVKFALGENVKHREGRFPNTRLGVEATLNRAFLEAVDYRRQWIEHTKFSRDAEFSRDPEGSASPRGAAKRLPPRRDLRLEALADIVNHEKFIHSHCYRADEILMLLRVASNLGIRVWSLQHVLEGYKIAPEIVAHGASCSTFSDWWAYKVEAYDATPYNAALLKEAGANVVIKSDNAELIRHMTLEAAKAVRYGNMSPDDALQTVTLNAARELGLDKRIGSIEVGKEADLAIYNGHPLDPFSRCEMTLIEGEVYFSRKHAPSAMSAEAAERSADPRPLVFPPDEVRGKKLDLAKSPSGRYAIVGATLHPVDGPEITGGTLLIEGEKIAAVGTGVEIPSGTKVIDGTGLHVSPGLIDAGTTVGLVEIGKVRETHDYSEGGLFQPDIRAGVGLNRDSELIPVARAGGITTILVRPTGGVVAGQASLAKLAGWTAPEMVLDLEAGLQINWPTGKNAKDRLRDLRSFLEQARRYDDVCLRCEKTGEPGPIPDPRLEALRPYLRGGKPVFIEADSRQAIAEALLFAEEQKLKLTITGGTDAWKLADALKRRDVPVIVGPVMRRPVEGHDPFDAPYANPGRLHEAGVRFCVRSDSASNSRNAPFEAAMAVAYGLPESEGLRAVTLSAAEILGIADRVGSLTPGKLANVVITDGSPLRQTTQIKGVFVEGTPFAPESRQTRFYEEYRRRLHEMRQERQNVAEGTPAD